MYKKTKQNITQTKQVYMHVIVLPIVDQLLIGRTVNHNSPKIHDREISIPGDIYLWKI